jgi:hypothetical protein
VGEDPKNEKSVPKDFFGDVDRRRHSVRRYAARPGRRLCQVNLISDIPGLATITDPELVNPWGVAHSSTSPFWSSNQGKSTATLYAVTDESIVRIAPLERASLIAATANAVLVARFALCRNSVMTGST